MTALAGSLLTVLLLLAPITPESGRFTIRQDGKTIGTEEFTIRSVGKGYVVDGKTQLVGDPASLASRMELDENLNPTSYEYKRGPGTIRLKIASPLSEMTITDGAASSSTDIRFPDSGSIIDNNFFHHYLILLYRVKGLDQRFGVFVPQDMQIGQARVRSTGQRTYALEVGDVKLEATVDAVGKLMRLAVPAAKVVVER
jgi:hypothetical protein